MDGTLYASSIFHRKIIRISPDGSISDFVSEGADGLLGVLGIKVDPRDRSVWAATAYRGASALAYLDRNGEILAQYRPASEANHEFNDLAIISPGEMLVTDDLDNAVYRLGSATGPLIRIALTGYTYPNGITFSAVRIMRT